MGRGMEKVKGKGVKKTERRRQGEERVNPEPRWGRGGCDMAGDCKRGGGEPNVGEGKANEAGC